MFISLEFRKFKVQIKKYLSNDMAKVIHKSYNQNDFLLLPPSLGELIPLSHPVRIVSDIIDKFDISAIEATYKGGGTSSFHPRMLLKVVVYAYLCNIYSGRQMEKQLQENIHFMWLSGMSRPDFRTINRFRSERLTDGRLDAIFTKVVELLNSEGVVSLNVQYIDGTKIESVANKYTFVWKGSVEKNRAKLIEKVKGVLSAAEEELNIEQSVEVAPELPQEEFDRRAERILSKMDDMGVSKGKARKEIEKIREESVAKIVEERRVGGAYRTLQDFIERIADRDVNKRAVENLIKAGACDSLDGTRKQMTFVYAAMIDQMASKKKTSVAGQMTLFDFASEEEKADYEIQYPDVGEFPKEMLLGFEKEVLGIYLSGHPLEEYTAKIRKNINAVASDFALLEAEEGNLDAMKTGAESQVKIKDNQHVIVGGMIAEKKVTFTRNNKAMAYITIEDLTGMVEVIIFPRDYEKYQRYLNADEKVFVVGRASVEDDKNGKIICERIVPFDETGCELWFQFATIEAYKEKESVLMDILRDSDGNDEVVIYVANPKAIKRLGKNQTVGVNEELLQILKNYLGENNVKVVETLSQPHSTEK